VNDAQQHIRAAWDALELAEKRFAEAAACIRAQPALKDMDARALSIARTHAETASMWAARAAG
jgi:hypothetical protein